MQGRNGNTFVRAARSALVALAAGCATGPVAAPSPGGDLGGDPGGPLVLPKTARGAEGRGSTERRRHELRAAEDVVSLCQAFRREEDVAFDGNEVGQARSREEHRQRRMEALDAHYRADVPAGGFSFKEYDLTERRLALDIVRGFHVGDGAEILPRDRDAPLEIEMTAGSAQAVLEQHAAQRLGLRLYFRPGSLEVLPDPCVRASGGRVVKLVANILAFELVGADGKVLAGRQNREFVEQSEFSRPVSAPAVRVGRPRNSDGRDVSDRVAAAATALGPALLPCYQKAIERRPSLRGTLVVGLSLKSDGTVVTAKMELSSLRDEALVSCALAEAAKLRLKGADGSTSLSVPVTFASKDDR